jgi:hypothetical protein
MTEAVEVHLPLSQVMARCRTNFMPGSMEPNRRNEFTLHAISQPMPRPEAEKLLEEWQTAVVDPGWEFQIVAGMAGSTSAERMGYQSPG